jgi:hypothetical protein
MDYDFNVDFRHDDVEPVEITGKAMEARLAVMDIGLRVGVQKVGSRRLSWP